MTANSQLNMTHKTKVRHDDPHMSGQRSRNDDGSMRKVREDKTAKHIEEQYDVEIPGRSDKQLKTILKEFEVASQTQLLKKLK